MKIKNQQGFSLIFVIVFIAMLSSLAIIAVKMGGLRALSMYNDTKARQAYYIAEAAYQHALFKINQDKNWRGDLLDQPFAGGTYSVNVSQTSLIDDITITAVGSVGGTERTIVRIILPPEKRFIIVAFAGTGSQGWGGNNGPALNAQFNRPRGIHKSSDGNVYIADTGNHEIRYVDAVSKNIYGFAGVGTQSGYNCNDCSPTSALLDTPEGVYIDTSGNVYIADTDNHIVRKVIAGGNIVNVAGTPGSGGFSGDGGAATSARLREPRDVVLDGNGNSYIADTRNCRIRRVDGVTSVITTYAGTGTCGFNGDGIAATSTQFNRPRGLSFDVAGNLYVADRDNRRIRKIDKITGIVTTVAGTGSAGSGGDGGPAVSAQLNNPQGVAVNQFGTMYIADTNNNSIRKVDPVSGIITTHAGTGTPGNAGDNGYAVDAQLNRPSRVTAFDDVDGHILISDTNNNRVREVTNAY